MVCITLSSILFLVNIYAIMNTMVSLKYTPSQDLEIVMNTSIWFNTYVFINIVVMIIYQNNLYTGYIDYSVATGVELQKKWSGKKLVIYGAPDIDFVERHGRWGYYLPGLRMNRYEGELCVYPSRNFDIEEVERELVRRGVPRMQTLKLPRQR